MQMGSGGEMDIEIVGLVEDAKYSEVKGQIPPVFVIPYRQDEQVGSHRQPLGSQPTDRRAATVRGASGGKYLPRSHPEPAVLRVRDPGDLARRHRPLRRARLHGRATESGDRIAHGSGSGRGTGPRLDPWQSHRHGRCRHGDRCGGCFGLLQAGGIPALRAGGSRPCGFPGCDRRARSHFVRCRFRAGPPGFPGPARGGAAGRINTSDPHGSRASKRNRRAKNLSKGGADGNAPLHSSFREVSHENLRPASLHNPGVSPRDRLRLLFPGGKPRAAHPPLAQLQYSRA
ncbi:hypothetical protein AC249_AIPGENE9381 [Exaiptasia diaphana]|nr:hypothetical protein AC249_AIPGENE9381 [Exaiptasia diaphana]